MHAVASAGAGELLRVLIECGHANANEVRASDGFTPLHAAVAAKQLIAVAALLRCGDIDVNAGQLALDVTLSCGDGEPRFEKSSHSSVPR